MKFTHILILVFICIIKCEEEVHWQQVSMGEFEDGPTTNYGEILETIPKHVKMQYRTLNDPDYSVVEKPWLAGEALEFAKLNYKEVCKLNLEFTKLIYSGSQTQVQAILFLLEVELQEQPYIFEVLFSDFDKETQKFAMELQSCRVIHRGIKFEDL